MSSLKFEVPGPPIGQGRPKFSTVCGHVRAYDPEKSRNYKAYVKLLATQAMKEQNFAMIDGPCSLEINAFFEVPKSKSKKFQQAALEGKEMPTKKPDADNVAKGVQDALNGLVYKDDCCIVELLVTKMYSDIPRTEIIVVSR